mgnify:CR=1 FL=1
MTRLLIPALATVLTLAACSRGAAPADEHSAATATVQQANAAVAQAADLRQRKADALAALAVIRARLASPRSE